MNHLLDIQIKDVAPHIFQRPILFVESNTQMLQVATFLAIGPEIYVVTNKSRQNRITQLIG